MPESDIKNNNICPINILLCLEKIFTVVYNVIVG